MTVLKCSAWMGNSGIAAACYKAQAQAQASRCSSKLFVSKSPRYKEKPVSLLSLTVLWWAERGQTIGEQKISHATTQYEFPLPPPDSSSTGVVGVVSTSSPLWPKVVGWHYCERVHRKVDRRVYKAGIAVEIGRLCALPLDTMSRPTFIIPFGATRCLASDTSSRSSRSSSLLFSKGFDQHVCDRGREERYGRVNETIKWICERWAMAIERGGEPVRIWNSSCGTNFFCYKRRILAWNSNILNNLTSNISTRKQESLINGAEVWRYVQCT